MRSSVSQGRDVVYEKTSDPIRNSQRNWVQAIPRELADGGIRLTWVFFTEAARLAAPDR